MTIEDGNQYKICGYENQIIGEIVKTTQCKVHINRFPKEQEMTADTIINSLANVSLIKYNSIQILIIIFNQESDVYLYELGVLDKRSELIDYV